MRYLTNIKSYYSIRQSTLSIDDIIETAKSQNKTGVVLCDKNMLGVKEAYDKCKANNLKLVIGLELTPEFGKLGTQPITVIAKNNKGYKELIKLSTDSELSKVNYQDFINSNNLIKILTSDGLLNDKLIEKDEAQYLEEISNIFRNTSDLYLGYSNDLNENVANYVNSRLFSNTLSQIDFNPLRAKDSKGIEALKTITEFQKEPLVTNGSQTLENQNSVFEHNTDYLFDMCNTSIEKEDVLPKCDGMEEEQAFNQLVKLVQKGIAKKYTKEEIQSKVPIKRAAMELSVIKNMGFSNYFLIVNDYVNWAKENGIEVGPGRGSAAGSIVAYTTDITEIDPLKYGLIFERFLNPERVTMPDIDVDFESARRQEVIDHIIEKWGDKYAAQIVTFTMYGYKQAGNDIAKANGLSVAEANEIKKLLPATNKTPEGFSCTKLYKEDFAFKNVIDKYNMKNKLEEIDVIAKMPRSLGTHAGGVVISGRPLTDVAPLIMTGGNVKNVQYSKKYIESVGLLKMDILAVDNLSKNKEILNLIKENSKLENLDLSKIDLNDKKVFDLINTRDTAGVFQLDTPVAKETIRQMKCNSFNDLVAVISLGRPGPMDNLPEFCARKNGKKPITYDVPELEPILKDTYGIIVFQEQVMQCATDLAGMSMAKADEMRRAMSSKKLSILEGMKVEFVEGCQKNGISKENAEKVYKTMEKFAEYGFNKSHAVCYSMIAYKLAYLKTYYPKEFYCSLLNHTTKKEDIFTKCRQKGIGLLPPSINEAKTTSLIKDNSIMLPITEIKGVGEAAASAIINERNAHGPFKDPVDFVERMEPKENSINDLEKGKNEKNGKKERNQLTEKVYSSLVKAGSLDEFGYNRTTLLKNYEEIKTYVENKDLMIMDDSTFSLTNYEDDIEKNIGFEKAVLEMNLKLDPISVAKRSVSDKVKFQNIGNITNQTKYATIVGEINSVKEIMDKNGRYMAQLYVRDETGGVKVTVFANKYDEVRANLVKGNIVALNGRYSVNEKYGNSISLNNMSKIDITSLNLKNKESNDVARDQNVENNKKKEQFEIDRL